jgi:chromosomal replication initiator protein
VEKYLYLFCWLCYQYRTSLEVILPIRSKILFWGFNREMREHPLVWQSALQTLQSMTTPEMFKSWLLPVEVADLQQESITLRVPTPFFQAFLRSNFEGKIIEALSQAAGRTFRLGFVVGGSSESLVTPFRSEASETKPAVNGGSGWAYSDESARPPRTEVPSGVRFESEAAGFSSGTSNASPFRSAGSSSYGSLARVSEATDQMRKGVIECSPGFVDASHTFESFIVSSGTQFAHAASKAAANFPGGKYNPLLIYGPSGLGKTHLLHAIAIQMLRNNPAARICYISAEQFVNEFIDALKNKSTTHFHNRYRSSFDAFLVDDIQYIGGKEKSEEEFFHTFNHLFSTQNQVVLTSDKPPKELHNLEERLVTRLQQGLLVDVKPPDLETRIAILKAKAEADDLYVPDDVCLMIAGHIRSNVRELEGALVRLSAEASINGSEITLELAREALSGIIAENKSSNLSIESINRCVCQYFKLTMMELSSKSRERKYSEPRQIAMYLARKYTKKTLPEIAAAYGGKDHSTVIHAIKKIEKEISSSTTVKKYLEDIQQLL